MILHAASIATFFVDQLAQAPVQIQCVQQTAPESWLKWLLPTIVQTVVSLASITAGVLIAVLSFRKNRQSEHEQWERNQQAGHEQWVRDHKKAEWRELMKKVTKVVIQATIDRPKPTIQNDKVSDVYDSIQHRLLKSITDQKICKTDVVSAVTSAAILEENARLIRGQAIGINVIDLVNLAQCIDDRIFIEREKLEGIYDQLAECMEKLIKDIEDKESCDESLQETQGKETLKKIREITERVRRAARKDLGIEELAKPDAMP
jgi:hypothetical protein